MIELGELQVLGQAFEQRLHIRADKSAQGLEPSHLAQFGLTEQVHSVFESGGLLRAGLGGASTRG